MNLTRPRDAYQQCVSCQRGRNGVVLNIDNNRLLQGDSVSLQPLSLKHLDELCEIGLDEGLWQWIPKPVQSGDDMRAYIEAALSGKAQGHMEPFAIRENGSGALVGSTRFGAISLPNKRLEIGWTWIGTKWQRTAVNTETKLLMLRYAFENLNCNRVEFKTDSLNERSRNAILRLGAQQEGILRKHIVTASGRLRDTVYFSIVKEEWPRVRANLEGKLARYASQRERLDRDREASHDPNRLVNKPGPG